ncbi:MAG: serine protease [Chloroflexota bacterium]
MAVEHLSMITTPVILLKGKEMVSQGTGFYYALQDSSHGTILFLVTNYHVLTGYPPKETKPPKGDNIVFYLHKDADNPGDVKQIRFPLFTKHGKPVWLSSKEFPQADVAVIPIVASLSADTQVFGISEDWTGSSMKVRPTSTITLIGYPYGYYDKKSWLPVWKTGSIASEPDVDFEGKPVFLVDVSAFPGMSGSPAFAIAYGAYETVEGATTFGHVQEFLGVYASMQMLREEKYLEEVTSESRLGVVIDKSLELGHVWKASLIIEIAKQTDVKKYESEVLGNLW